jgi:RHS repeat-associated protein
MSSNEIYDYGARMYSALTGRFLQPDTIVPEPGNPQALNKYSYVYNNPVRYTDPTGHCIGEAPVPCPEDMSLEELTVISESLCCFASGPSQRTQQSSRAPVMVFTAHAEIDLQGVGWFPGTEHEFCPLLVNLLTCETDLGPLPNLPGCVLPFGIRCSGRENLIPWDTLGQIDLDVEFLVSGGQVQARLRKFDPDTIAVIELVAGWSVVNEISGTYLDDQGNTHVVAAGQFERHKNGIDVEATLGFDIWLNLATDSVEIYPIAFWYGEHGGLLRSEQKTSWERVR